jgi:hypothetical protein
MEAAEIQVAASCKLVVVAFRRKGVGHLDRADNDMDQRSNGEIRVHFFSLSVVKWEEGFCQWVDPGLQMLSCCRVAAAVDKVPSLEVLELRPDEIDNHWTLEEVVETNDLRHSSQDKPPSEDLQTHWEEPVENAICSSPHGNTERYDCNVDKPTRRSHQSKKGIL